MPVKNKSGGITVQSKVDEVDDKYMLSFDRNMTLQAAGMNAEQLMWIFSKTPSDHIQKRPGKGGQNFDYVTGTYVKKVLNFVFGFDWDFEVVQTKETAQQVIVLGKLTVRTGKTYSNRRELVKMQWGRADIKFPKDDKKTPLDLGNDYKAATTDALKKCAAEFGIAGDVYGKNEFKEVTVEITKKPTSNKEAIKDAIAKNKAEGKSALDQTPPDDDYDQTKQK